MVDITFLILTILCGAFYDWIFQLEWVFNNKNNMLSKRFIRIYTLHLHSAVYATLTYLTVSVLIGHGLPLYVWVVLLLSHIFIDSRLPINAILKLKGIPEEDYLNCDRYGYLITNVDNRLHELVIIILAILV